MPGISLTREELYKLVWKESITSLAVKYNTTFEELRKLCEEQQIPIPQSGYWMKLKYGKPVEIKPLEKIDLKYEQENNMEKIISLPLAKQVTPIMTLQKEIESDSNISLIVPYKLNKPDILISQAKETILNPGTPENDYKSKSGFYWWQVLKIDVSHDNLDRALRFMDTLIKALRQRGHNIEPGKETFVIIHEAKISISCREKNKRVNVEGRYGNTTELIRTGILVFSIEGGFYGKEWKDGRVKLEQQLSNIIAKLELEGKRKKEQTEDARKWRQEYEEQKRIELAEKEAIKKEQENFENLLSSAKKHQEASMLREYISAMELAIVPYSKLNEKIEPWLKWAKMKLNNYDQLGNISEDSIIKFLSEFH